MPRRTVNVADGLDRAIRTFQARMIVDLDRDVTYTEALNNVLLLGFLRPGPTGEVHAYWKPGSPKADMDDLRGVEEGMDMGMVQFLGLMSMLPQLGKKAE